MPWSRSRPRSQRYDHQHQADRDQHMDALRQAGTGQCAERICVQPSRLITPSMPLHLCHDRATGLVLGLGHAACNLAEAGRYARAKQSVTQHRL